MYAASAPRQVSAAVAAPWPPTEERGRSKYCACLPAPAHGHLGERWTLNSWFIRDVLCPVRRSAAASVDYVTPYGVKMLSNTNKPRCRQSVTQLCLTHSFSCTHAACTRFAMTLSLSLHLYLWGLPSHNLAFITSAVPSSMHFPPSGVGDVERARYHIRLD